MDIIKKKCYSLSFDITLIPRKFVPTLRPKDDEINKLIISPLKLYKDNNQENNELNSTIDKSIEEDNFNNFFVNINRNNFKRKSNNTILKTLIEKNKLKNKI